MPYSIGRERGRQVLKLEGAVRIRHAQDLAVRLAEELDEGAPVGVETASLEEIDTCVLQLLCSLRKTVPALSFESPSRVFVDAVDRLGLRRQLLGAWEGS